MNKNDGNKEMSRQEQTWTRVRIDSNYFGRTENIATFMNPINLSRHPVHTKDESSWDRPSVPGLGW
jgi:hypothetical protein